MLLNIIKKRGNKITFTYDLAVSSMLIEASKLKCLEQIT